MKTAKVKILNEEIGGDGPLLIIAGPCVIESREVVFHTASRLKEICSSLGLPFVLKSSYDKANRSSVTSFRGPGLQQGLKILEEARASFGVPVISDVHSVAEVEPAARALDALQIPAFLSRQTDLLLAVSNTGKPGNIKKGQFLSPQEMGNAVEKFTSTGNRSLMLTERGSAFGYNNLVVDMRGIPIMKSFGYPVIFDATHSVQLPGGQGMRSGGQREFALTLARAAVAAGADGIFMEVHPEPEKALCDGPNMIVLEDVYDFLAALKRIKEAL
ncbi:MAG: 3-deoxy-8-phosphooctulonate synthase [Nitrospiraceae bacterium]|nr:3-deoxy-8-phosphooctulonate synthase [Nitrospiraceae bacterium]